MHDLGSICLGQRSCLIQNHLRGQLKTSGNVTVNADAEMG